MANQRGTFTKRRREQELQERARAKNERRASKRNGPRATGGPQIAWDEAVGLVGGDRGGAVDGDAAATAPGEPAPAAVGAGGHEAVDADGNDAPE
jgi:hypothetical protein